MAEIRGFVAATLDGYIASPDGGIDWLEEFGKLDYGYDAFIAQIETVVIGRRTQPAPYRQLFALNAAVPRATSADRRGVSRATLSARSSATTRAFPLTRPGRTHPPP